MKAGMFALSSFTLCPSSGASRSVWKRQVNAILLMSQALTVCYPSSPPADTCSSNHSICQPLVLGPRRGAQKTREMAEGAGAPPTGT